MPRISAIPQKLIAAVKDRIPIYDPALATTKTIEVGLIMPAGSILDFAGSNAPAGFLLCYGQTLNATSNPQYEDLWNAIGTTYGGTGKSSFMLPDLRGRVIAGKGNMGGTAANRLTTGGSGIDPTVLGGSGGAETHTLTIAQMPNHKHTVGHVNHSAGPGPVSPNADWVGYLHNSGWGGNGPGDYDVGNANYPPTGDKGGGQAHNNVQPTFILNKIIKY